MGDFNVSIRFTQDQVELINSQGFKLCFSSGVGDNPVYNVIAWADAISTKVDISWTDSYFMAATKQTFSNGTKISISNDPTDIVFQQLYTLPPLFTNGIVTNDSTVPQGSFTFYNTYANTARAVVYKMVQGVVAPFYISERDVFSLGTENLMPKSNIALWFQANADTAKMVSINKAATSTFDMTGQSSLALSWNGSKFVPRLTKDIKQVDGSIDQKQIEDSGVKVQEVTPAITA